MNSKYEHVKHAGSQVVENLEKHPLDPEPLMKELTQESDFQQLPESWMPFRYSKKVSHVHAYFKDCFFKCKQQRM